MPIPHRRSGRLPTACSSQHASSRDYWRQRYIQPIGSTCARPSMLKRTRPRITRGGRQVPTAQNTLTHFGLLVAPRSEAASDSQKSRNLRGRSRPMRRLAASHHVLNETDRHQHPRMRMALNVRHHAGLPATASRNTECPPSGPQRSFVSPWLAHTRRPGWMSSLRRTSITPMASTGRPSEIGRLIE